MIPQTPREFALAYAWRYIGLWYKWGGDDPSGFDCSGYVIEILKAVGILSRQFDTNADNLYRMFEQYKITEPIPGALVFWYNAQRNKKIHIEMMITEKLSIGASGGGSKTLTIEDAVRDNAFIKIRPIASRSNIAGFVDPFEGILTI